MQLSRALPWRMFIELVVKDLKNTTSKGRWWMGRKIKVRIHLGAYLLQCIYNLTDHKIEYQLRDNAAFQLFCGQGIVSDWHAPDHTKIEDFRSRLSPETQRQLANLTAQAAVSLGFADPRILTKSQIAALPWNIKRAFDTLKNDAWRYLLDVGHFTRSHTIKAGKILSFHAKELACINKGKLGKDKEFGRVFQLGRVGGNFMIVLKSTSVMMSDKKSFIPFLEEHQTIFGAGVLESVATDKGYWTSKNKRALTDLTITTAGFAKPGKSKKDAIDLDLQERLHNRRAGIEPLIGHTKKGGQLGKSRMKSDTATLAAGYGSVLA